MKRFNIISLVILMLLVIPLSNAEDIGGNLVGKQNTCIYLIQNLVNSSYVNLTQVIYPQLLTPNKVGALMTKSGPDYSYPYCNTRTMGEYSYTTCGDVDLGEEQCVSKSFFVTADGNPYRNFPIVFGIIIVGLLFLIFATALKKQLNTNLFKVFGSVLFIIAGVITLYPGFNYTNYSTLDGLALGLVLIGIGGFILSMNAEGLLE